MGHLSIQVERAFNEQDDVVLMSLGTALGEFPVRMSPDQARSVAAELTRFADSADPEVPFVAVPLVSSCKRERDRLLFKGSMDRSDTQPTEGV